MSKILHITSGDIAGDSLVRSGVPGDVFVWHDILYDGPRASGWPEPTTYDVRARFLVDTTAGGLTMDQVVHTLAGQYQKLARAGAYDRVVLWFDACLFDQSMLTHILTCLRERGIDNADLLCVDAFPGIDPYNGLGQLKPSQLAGLYGRQNPVTDAQFAFAKVVEAAFAHQDQERFSALSLLADAPLPWIPAAVKRWLAEQPDSVTGLGQLEQLALDALRKGCETPWEIFAAVAEADTAPQFWGDITLWAKLNALADRTPPLVRIQGPAQRLPQWESNFDLKQFKISREMKNG
jgi:hypothetical protein